MNKRHTPEQIVRMLRQAEAELAAGASVPEVARRLGISEATLHRWRNHYGGMKADAMKRLKKLEKENARLKKIVADQALGIFQDSVINTQEAVEAHVGQGGGVHPAATTSTAGFMSSADKTKLNSLSSGLVNGAGALRYSAFLADANNNHQEAFQNAIDHIYSSSAAYSKHLDLEGATVNLTGPVSAPIGGPSGTRSIYNGEIRAQAGFAGGDYMLNILGDVPSHYLRLVNLTFNGQTNASWIKWDRGNLVIEASQFKNPKAGATVSTIPAGLYCSDGGAGSNADAGFWINNCWFSTDDAAVQPSDRMTIGILSETGDNKIGGGTTMSYFRHCFIYESFACIIAGLHVFQGVPRDTEMTDHTPSIKFTNGRNGSTINGLYLGKSFMEISNETNPTQTKIGEMVITNMRAFMDNGQANAAHLVARNYGGSTASVQDISVTNCLFVNGGAVQTTPSKLFNPSAFDCNNCKGVLFADNVFKTPSVQPQANPCTLKKTFGSVSNHTFDFTGYLPFAGRPRTLLNATGKRSGGTAQIMEEGAISADAVEVVTPSAWAGDITATVTVNNTQSSGFLDG